MIQFWKVYNAHLAELINSIPDIDLKKKVENHNFHEILMIPLSKEERVSLEDLVVDYIAHLNHHLQQILK